jgi:hypothetical protein
MDSSIAAPDCRRMGLSCSACGFRSENRAFFRREKAPPFAIARWFCAGCKPLPTARVGWVRLLFFAVLMALGAWVVLNATSDNKTFGYVMVVFGGFVCLSPITVLIHEAGHAVAAAAVGRRVYSVHIGTGAPFKTIRLGQVDIVIGRDQRGGYVLCLPKGAESRWREACMVAAGPAANLAAMVGLGGLAGVVYGTGALPWQALASVAVTSLTVSNAFVGVFALIPMKVKLGEFRWLSDGGRLLQLLRPRRVTPDWQAHHDAFRGGELLQAKRWTEAEAHYRTIFSDHPDQPGFLGALLHVLALAKGPDAAMACAMEHEAYLRPDEPPTEPYRPIWAATWGNAAWAILRSPEGDLVLADEFSARAAEADSISPYPSAVRAAVLARSNPGVEHLDVILGRLKNMASASDKLEFCDFIVAEGLESPALTKPDFESFAAHLRTLA